MPADAAVSQYRLLQKRIGTTRVVIVTPRNYATQNQVTVDAIRQLGPTARGVAVLRPTVTDAELQRLHNAGLPSSVVFDHLGRPPLPAGVEHPSHRIIRELIERGRTWVKLSGAYLNARLGPPYPEATKIANAFVQAAPERMVWGSDWPHPSEAPDHKPNDAVLFDLLSAWAPDAVKRHRILVENPATLYGFVT